MSGEAIGILGIVIMFVMLALGMPIAFVMALVGFVGTFLLTGFTSGFNALGLIPYVTVLNWLWVCIPMFILMGSFAGQAGISRMSFDAANKWLGRLPGGLGMATTVACGAFAACCGSSTAAAVTMANVCIPEMDRHNYDKSFSAGCVAAGGTIGILIPPSINMIVYAQITEVSIGKMFAAGFIPGILEIIVYCLVIWVIARRKPLLAPRAESFPAGQMIRSLAGLVPVIILFGIVMGGIYTGVFTPTEAGGLGAFAAFVMALLAGKLKWKNLTSSLMETGRTSSMIFLLVVGGMLYMHFLALSGLPTTLAHFIIGLELPAVAVIAIIIFVYLILGTFLNVMGMLLLTVPIFFPVILTLGFHPIWFGIIVVRASEIAMITPPVGLNVYVVASAIKDIRLEQVFKGIIPFLIGDIITLVFLVAFPQISLFLPSLMYVK